MDFVSINAFEVPLPTECLADSGRGNVILDRGSPPYEENCTPLLHTCILLNLSPPRKSLNYAVKKTKYRQPPKFPT